MIYPSERDIIEYFVNLPQAVRDEFAELLERGQRDYRRVRQLEPLNEEKQIAVLYEIAAEVFKTRVATRLRERAGNFDAFRTAIGMDGGDGELAFWHAHRLYNLAERGRMLFIWHQKIQSRLWDRLSEAENLWYTPEIVPESWRAFLERTAAKNGVPTSHSEKSDVSNPTAPVADNGTGNARSAGPAEGGTTGGCWADLEIRFLSDERVQITAPGKSETRNYAEMGFIDRRTEQPTLAWGTLRHLAEHRGTLRNGREAGAKWADVEKRVQEIRKRLRELHRAAGDPLPFIKKDEHGGKVSGYEAQFRILCAPSYKT